MSRFHKAYSFDDVMLTPRYSTLHSRTEADLRTNVASVPLKIPIIAANMSSVCEDKMAIALGELGGLGIIHRMNTVEEQASLVLSASSGNPWCPGQLHETFPIGFSIGIGEDWYNRMDACRKYASLVCLDIAHGHHERVIALLKKYYESYKDYPIIISQVATAEAVRRLLEVIPEKYLYSTAFKASIGGGSLCTTRIKTGFGIPTLQSILDIRQGVSPKVWEAGLTLVADGGIKNSGDIVKALAAGAHCVMLGNLLAGTDEAPGQVIIGHGDPRWTNDSQKWKVYRGSASFSDKSLRREATTNIEGEETLVPYRGSVKSVISGLLDGIRSGMSYGGSQNLSELQENAEFIEITSAGLQESLPHGI